MSGFFNPLDPQELHSYPHTLQDLEELPEDPTQLPPQFYDPASAVEGSQEPSGAGFPHGFEQETVEASGSEPKAPSKPRRRPPPGSDHVKHRRTRSGCYTCRQRRVKCDETHPVCERCNKGSRECTWPEPSSSSKSGSKSTQQKKVEPDSGSSSEDYEDEEGDPTVEPRTEDSVSGKTKNKQSLSSLKNVARKQSKASLNQKRTGGLTREQIKEKSLSPSTDESKSLGDFSISSPSSKLSTVSTNTSQDDYLWTRLKPDQHFYLNFHRQSINHFYYFFKHDPNLFLQNGLVERSLSYDPLLYAVVGFSAFHYALQKNGKISDFLGYYNKSVSLLRRDLQSGRRHSVTTILTILQLATFEEYLGDWVNLMGHQKAAFEMIKEIFTPETIVATDEHRKLLTWYARFDLMAGLMAGNKTILGKEWFSAHEQRTIELLEMDPNDMAIRIENVFAHHRVLGFEMAQLFAKLSQGELTVPEFMQEHRQFLEKVADWRAKVHSFRSYTECLVMDFGASPALDPDDIVNPYQPGRLFKEPLYVANYMMLDSVAFEAVIKYQTALILQQPPPPELLDLSLEQCQIFEAIEMWSGSPPGAIMPAQNSLGLCCLSLPPTEKHISWCRKKLVKLENSGYVYPPSLRSKLAEQWGMPFINEWWLPNEEQLLPLIRSIRAFTQDRTVKPRNQASEDIRTMKALLAKLNIDDSPRDSPESSSSVQDSITVSSNDTASIQPDFEIVNSMPAAGSFPSGQGNFVMGSESGLDQQFSGDDFADWSIGGDQQQGYWHQQR